MPAIDIQVLEGVFTDEDYLSQMESEHRVKEKNTWMWKQIGKRANHYWDCESMQAAAATMLKIIGRESVDTPDSTDGDD